MTTLQALVIAVLQGATELFPVSSLGHAVLLPALLRWNIDPSGQAFLPFLVMLHVGTAAALLLFFWRDWWRLLCGLLGLGGRERVGESRRVLWLLIVATIPAVVVGGLLEHFLRRLFESAMVAAAFLAVNGARGAQAAARGHARRHAAAVPAGRRGGRGDGAAVHRLPDALVPPARPLGADAVRLVLRGGGTGQHGGALRHGLMRRGEGRQAVFQETADVRRRGAGRASRSVRNGPGSFCLFLLQNKKTSSSLLPAGPSRCANPPWPPSAS